MDQKTTPQQHTEKPIVGDNSNAPGTYPAGTSSARVLPNLASNPIAQRNSADPKAPLAADPLNGGIPRSDATEAPSSVVELELGGTGTILVGGILTEADYNPEMSGRRRIEIYDKMRKSDATVRLGLSAVKYPLLAADWYIKPGQGEDENGEKTLFVKQELFNNPNFRFIQFFKEALTFCDFGASHFEKVFRKRMDGKFGWKHFGARGAKTIYRYTMNDGVTPGLTQILPTGGVGEIPDWKLLSFILDQEGSNYEGVSLLRAAHMHWYYKDLYYRIDAIASERQGIGVPIIRVPSQATPKDKAKAKEIARNMRVNQEAYVDLPTGFTFEYVDTKSQTLKQVNEMVLHHDRQILKAFISHFLDMGNGNSGARDLSKDQSDLYYLGEWYLAQIFQGPMNLAIRELVALNWSGLKQEEYPTLEHGYIGSADFTGMAEAVSKYTSAGIILPDDTLERHVRKGMHLPEAEDVNEMDDEQKARRKIGMPQPDPFALEAAKQGMAPDGKIMKKAGDGKEKPDPKKDKLPVSKQSGKIINEEQAEAMQQFMTNVYAFSEAIGEAIQEKQHAAQ